MRFETLRVGTLTEAIHFDAEHTALESSVRLLRDSDGFYRFLFVGLSEAYASEAEALEGLMAHVASYASPRLTSELTWRADLAPGLDEHACPICGAPTPLRDRELETVCAACVLEAVDERGRAISFRSENTSEGVIACYRADGSTRPGGECLIRGTPCVASEHRWGGLIIRVAEHPPQAHPAQPRASNAPSAQPRTPSSVVPAGTRRSSARIQGAQPSQPPSVGEGAPPSSEAQRPVPSPARDTRVLRVNVVFVLAVAILFSGGLYFAYFVLELLSRAP